MPVLFITSAFFSPHLCENVVRLTEDPSGISIRSHEEFQRADVDVSAQCPEVRLLQVIHTLQLLHLQREPQDPTANDYAEPERAAVKKNHTAVLVMLGFKACQPIHSLFLKWLLLLRSEKKKQHSLSGSTQEGCGQEQVVFAASGSQWTLSAEEPHCGGKDYCLFCA